MNIRKLIYVCSPLRGDLESNIKRAREFSKYVVMSGHTPYTPHLFFTQFLDDNIQEERDVGIQMGIQMLYLCDEMWVFGKKISSGMKMEIDYAERRRIKVVYK